MSTDATVLLVDDDPRVCTVFRAVLAREGGFAIETAENGTAALALARRCRPDLIVSDVAMPGMDGLALCRAIKGDRELAGAMFVVVSGIPDPDLRHQALDAGVDDFLAKPVEAAALTAKVRALLRLKRLHGEVGRSYDQLLALLVQLLDLGLPGAADRGRRLADTALALARRFEVPAEFLRDLELAALLHEIGFVVDPDRARLRLEPRVGEWRAAVTARIILQQVERLRPVAEIVGALAEHWDGSGMPGKLTLGQIPLRARLLRVAIEFFALLERPAAHGGPLPAADAVAELRRHAGTKYDPAVVVQLAAMLHDAPELARGRSRICIPVEALEAGMVLAEDLSTNTGMKLLARGATIGHGTLAIIRNRHAAEPIVAGAWVHVAGGDA